MSAPGNITGFFMMLFWRWFVMPETADQMWRFKKRRYYMSMGGPFGCLRQRRMQKKRICADAGSHTGRMGSGNRGDIPTL